MQSKRAPLRVLRLAACVAAVSLASHAGAQSLPSRIYDDLKSIFQDLIERQVGHGVGNLLAKRSPPLCFYLREAVTRLESSEWGNVAGALRDGLADLVGDFVYWVAARSETKDGESGGLGTLLREFWRKLDEEGMTHAKAATSCRGSAKDEDDSARRECCSARGWGDAGQAALLDGKRCPSGVSSDSPACKPRCPGEFSSGSVACMLGKLARSAIRGQAIAPEQMKAFLAAIVWRTLRSKAPLRDLPENGQAILGELLRRALNGAGAFDERLTSMTEAVATLGRFVSYDEEERRLWERALKAQTLTAKSALSADKIKLPEGDLARAQIERVDLILRNLRVAIALDGKALGLDRVPAGFFDTTGTAQREALIAALAQADAPRAVADVAVRESLQKNLAGELKRIVEAWRKDGAPNDWQAKLTPRQKALAKALEQTAEKCRQVSVAAPAPLQPAMPAPTTTAATPSTTAPASPPQCKEATAQLLGSPSTILEGLDGGAKAQLFPETCPTTDLVRCQIGKWLPASLRVELIEDEQQRRTLRISDKSTAQTAEDFAMAAATYKFTPPQKEADDVQSAVEACRSLSAALTVLGLSPLVGSPDCSLGAVPAAFLENVRKLRDALESARGALAAARSIELDHDSGKIALDRLIELAGRVVELVAGKGRLSAILEGAAKALHDGTISRLLRYIEKRDYRGIASLVIAHGLKLLGKDGLFSDVGATLMKATKQVAGQLAKRFPALEGLLSAVDPSTLDLSSCVERVGALAELASCVGAAAVRAALGRSGTALTELLNKLRSWVEEGSGPYALRTPIQLLDSAAGALANAQDCAKTLQSLDRADVETFVRCARDAAHTAFDPNAIAKALKDDFRRGLAAILSWLDAKASTSITGTLKALLAGIGGAIESVGDCAEDFAKGASSDLSGAAKRLGECVLGKASVDVKSAITRTAPLVEAFANLRAASDWKGIAQRAGALFEALAKRADLWPAPPSTPLLSELRSFTARIESTSKDLLQGARTALDRCAGLQFPRNEKEAKALLDCVKAALVPEPKEPSAFEEFIGAFITYLAEIDEAGARSDLAREAFRRSAVTLLDKLIGKGPGYPRSGEIQLLGFEARGKKSPCEPLLAAWIPSPTLRASFNEVHARTGSDNFRFVATLDAFPILRWAFNDYLGLRITALDLMGPLSELALRKQEVKYADSLWLDFIRPRFDFWFVIPQLTKHVAITAGVGIRFVGVEPNPGATANDAAPSAPGLRYTNSASVEFSLGASLSF